jgi:hypothetical protein
LLAAGVSLLRLRIPQPAMKMPTEAVE